MDAVDQVLAQRARQQAGPSRWTSLAAAALLHAAVVGVALLLPRFETPPPPLEFVPVTVMPAQALGVERPLARPSPPTPAPPEPAPQPTPAPAPEPPPAKPAPKPKPQPEEREPPVDQRPALPEPEEKPKPAEKSGKGSEKAGKKPPPSPAAPATGHAGPGGVAAVGKGEEIGRRGSALATLTAPGLWMQRITTKPPSDDQAAVAIQALEGAMKLEKSQGGQLVIA